MPVKYKDKTPEQRAKYLEYQRAYKKKNAEKFSEWKRNWYETHREEIRAYQKAWRAAHPNYYKEWREKQKAPKPAAAISHSAGDKDRCPVCGSKDIGKTGRNMFYCWNCAVEFNDKAVFELTRQGIRIKR